MSYSNMCTYWEGPNLQVKKICQILGQHAPSMQTFHLRYIYLKRLPLIEGLMVDLSSIAHRFEPWHV
jgi:hypothetical protein